VLCAGACDRDSSSSGAGGAAPPKIVPDASLPADEYVAQGFPSHDRPWSGREMAVAAEKLKALSTRKPQHLPRRGSANSGAVFARLVAIDNLAFFRNRSLPIVPDVRGPGVCTVAERGPEGVCRRAGPREGVR
jgi:hypothetical protein